MKRSEKSVHRRDAESAERTQRGDRERKRKEREEKEKRKKREKREKKRGEKVRINDLTKEVIGAAIEVHRVLGPGLLESAYEECLCHELDLRSLHFERQKTLPVVFKDISLNCAYRLDLLVASLVVVEIKAVEAFLPVHEAQLLTYLKLGGWKVGLLINFNVPVLKKGIKRIVLGLNE